MIIAILLMNAEISIFFKFLLYELILIYLFLRFTL